MSDLLDLIAPKGMSRRTEIAPLLEHLSRSRTLVGGLPVKLLEILETLDRGSAAPLKPATGSGHAARGISDIRGMIGTHPEFAALWLIPDSETITDSWAKGVLLVILASAVALGTQTTGARLSARQSGGLAVRRAFADETLKSELKSIFNTSTTGAINLCDLPARLKLRAKNLSQLAEQTERDPKHPTSVSRHLLALSLLIEYVIEARTPRERRAPTEGGDANVITSDIGLAGSVELRAAEISASQPPIQLRAADSSVGSPRSASLNQAASEQPGDLHQESVDEVREAAAEFGIQGPETAATRARRKDVGVAARGERARPENVVSPDLSSAARRAPPTQKYRAIRNQYRAMAMRAQHLPTVDSRLQLYDLKVLLTWIGEQSTEESSYLWCRVLCSLLLGMPLEAVDQLIVYDSPPDLATASPPAFGLCRHPYCWVIPSIAIEEAFIPSDDQRHLYFKTAAWVALPLPFGTKDDRLNAGISRFTYRVGRIEDRNRIFPLLAPSTSGALSLVTSQLNSLYGTQLTPRRIAQFFPRYLTNVTGDVALSCVVLGSADQDRRAARLNYYAPLTDEVSATYSKSLEQLWKGTGVSKSFVPSVDLNTSPSAGLRIGSAAVADPGQLTLAVRRLASSVSTHRVALEEDIETFHNLFTAYTVAMVLWGSGIRAVHDPIEWTLLTIDEGSLIVSDKDGDEYADSRVVSLPSCALKQLHVYRRHLEWLLTKLSPVSHAACPDRIHFIDQGKTSLVTPKRLTEVWGDSFPFRASAQRHFLRTFLRERGAKAVMVDAWLGHGSYGEEAYGAYSCLSAFDVRAEILPLLETLMAECGWQIIEGLGGGE